MAKPRRGGGRPPKGGKKLEKPASIRPDDVYEAEDSDPDELKHAGRYDEVDNYEYEMPSDFEDEDIDDEMAFTEEDKKMFGHLFDDEGPARGAGGEEDGDDDLLSSGESGDEEEGEDGEEGWSEEEDDEEEEGGRRGRRGQRDEMDELFGGASGGSSDEDLEAGSEGAEDEEAEEDEEGAEQRHQAMLDAVTGGAAAAQRKKRRAKEAVVTEAYPESQYNLPPSAAGGELTVADLIAGLGDSKGKLGQARKALERLEKRAAPVAAPLPGPIKQRQERKAGYEETKKEADKWLPIIKANREAPTLRFTADKSAVPRVTTTAALAAKHQPETDMESQVAALLEAAGAHSAKAVTEAEEALAMKALSVEEARERQNRLARMRALLFYHEAKARRLKKIKSKEYRRKLKKAEKRKALAAGEEGDEEQLKLMLEQAEFDRAKERLTLKHKNTSRWARRALKRGQPLMDDGTRAAVAEQLRLGEELRQRVNRMKAKGGDSDGSTSASEEESDGDEGAPGAGDSFAGPNAGRGMSAKVKAAALEILEGKVDAELPSKGLLALPFMRRSLERKKAEAQQAAEEALAELDGAARGDPSAAAAAVGGAGRAGRLAFTGTGVDQRQQYERVSRLEAAALNDDSDLASDEDEDAEAKAQRLGKRLGLVQPDDDAEQQQQQQQERQLQLAGAGGIGAAEAAAAAAGAAAAAAAGGAVAVTDGPIDVSMPSRSRKAGSREAAAALNGSSAPDGAQQEQEQQQQQQRGGSAPQPDWLFGGGKQGGAGAAGKQGGKQGGKQPAGAVVGVSIGPASGGAAEQQQNGVAPPAASEQQQQGEGDEAPAQPSFVRSKTFQGARPGYVFKKGPQGVGYYLDGAEAAKAARAARQRQKKAEAAARRKQQQEQQEAAAEDSEDEGLMKPLPGSGLGQAELIRRAFAGDDVVAEFAAAKAAEVEGELPQEDLPGVLPGWGTWAGQQREPQWIIDARRKAQQRKESAAASRKDAKLQYVVISEKWDKKSAKYKTPSVPFPFDSRETYERAMRQPLGREYNTDASFRNLTRPAVLKDAGVIIEPIRFSKAMAEHDEQAKGGSKRAAVTTIAGGMPKKSKQR